MSETLDDDKAADTASKLVEDLFEHQEFAEKMVRYLEGFQGGKVISLRAPWGRGKTDVLRRAFEYASKRKYIKESPVIAAIWLNPWQYGRADLLSPLLNALINEIAREKLRSDGQKLVKIVEKLTPKGLGMAMKAKYGDAAGTATEDALRELIEARTREDYSPDPIAPLGSAFRELIERFLARQAENKTQVIIFVDDLDRCPPKRQIELLEAFHFLVDAQANATIVMAVDGAILANSAKIHYGTDEFDVNRYLDKIFDFNLELPSLTADEMRKFVVRVENSLLAATAGHRDDLPSNFKMSLLEVLRVFPQFRNPRNLERFLTKLIAYCRQKFSLPEGPTDLVLFWMLTMQTWPEVRFTLNDVIARGPVMRTGGQEEMAVRAVLEFLKRADREPFSMLDPNQQLPLGSHYPWKTVVAQYSSVVAELSARGL